MKKTHLTIILFAFLLWFAPSAVFAEEAPAPPPPAPAAAPAAPAPAPAPSTTTTPAPVARKEEDGPNVIQRALMAIGRIPDPTAQNTRIAELEAEFSALLGEGAHG